MFYIIGVGLKPKQLTLEAMECIRNCKEVYIDNYTNIFSQGDLKELEDIIEKKITPLNRTELEQEKKYLKDGSCLLVIGNPLSATTHFTLIEEAKKKKLDIKIIAGISIFNYRGISGLFEYKFGKTTSIVYPDGNYRPTSFYDCIIENLKNNAHTLCLLDIKTDKKKFMSIFEACQILEEIDNEKDKKLKDVVCVGLCGVAGIDQEIITFDFLEYKKIKCKSFPQSLIICAALNDIERDGINEYRC
ncbi:MAG TPA: diphthine synthase [Candidatus Diapherotrites archaeon]|nr:diphthine synthase [Candidatus Diapherotrites archaeon]